MNKKEYYHKKTILITGAASGIGKRFAEKVSEVADVKLVLWDRNPQLLSDLKLQIGDRAEVHIANVDISDPQRIVIASDQCMKQNLLPDIIINCAGVVIGKMFHEHTYDDIRNTIVINTEGSMYVVRAFINEMIERGSGHIVNLGSASGYIGNPRMSVYASSKWGVHGWAESLRIEMKKLKTGIHVTTVIPSYIDTGMFDGVKAPFLTPILKTDDIVDKMLKGIAAGKEEIKAPFIVRFVPLLKAVLPSFLFDWFAGNVLGVYKSMDSFKGRKPNSE
ncbi:MAG: SDR family NAD(P)-dependent oxidoreductase [Balneolaceae bacterium]|nr:MAG: SDR family NAD(P)-dependent oxidoreductase [Balneolaceae bacterium]